MPAPDRVAQDQEGDDRQHRDPVEADEEGEGAIERCKAHQHDEGHDLVVERVQEGGQQDAARLENSEIEVKFRS